ncbi:EF-hand protein (macronuclear) [Tetrahymena thermophila SB210]|uniref:EF-hand protein n=1 Tax=Tetrahymena thermophila (strain SB210) TaxID=312017 RepID=I7M1S2_TETTS|nr:EF-hand protein [Tetrahymena thermophila SB210]EAR97473.2 EF-hand protein [Tetrahymena thermophila SB210]|eukprot:XP_001017718.2 EF-hand protein [Tetrahymena thermophila SB210]
MEKHLEYLNQLDKNEIDNFKRTYMHNLVTMKWLKIRYLDKAKKQYLFFPDELHKHYEINELFRGFDADHSEGIDIQELINMFKDNKINLDRQDVDSIFKIIDFNGDHTLNLSEFKQSVFSDEINSQFAKVMRELREKIDKKEESERKKKEANYLSQLGLGESVSTQEIKSQRQLEQNNKLQKKLTRIFIRQPSLTNNQFGSNSSNNNQKEQISSRSNNEKNQSENKLEKKDGEELEDKVQRVVPTTFSSMVEFFSYNFQRKEMIKKCKQLHSTQVGQKLNELSNLLTLNSKYSEHTIQKIQKFTNKNRFHSFNLLSDIENEHNDRLSDDQTETGKDKQLDKNNSSQTNQEKSFRKTISYSLSPNKYQNNDQQIQSIPEIDSFEKSSVKNKNKNEEFQISQIISSPQLTSEALKSSHRLNVSQNACQSKQTIKKKHLSSDISHSTQDKTNIQSQQQLNIASLNFLSSVNQQLPHEQPHIQITQFTPQNIQKLNFNKTNLKLKLNNSSLYQQQPNQQDQQNKTVNSSRNSPAKRQLNKLQKIINEQEQMKLASIQKFIQNKPSRKQSQTSYGLKRIQIYKPQNFNINNNKNKQSDHSSTQMQNSMINSQIEDYYNDTHLLNGSINENSNKLYLYNNPFSKKKRSSHYMSQTITSSKQNYYNSLQNSPRMNQNSKFGSQKPSQSETQATSQVSLLDEGVQNDKKIQKQQFMFNQGNKIQIRSKQKQNSDIQFLNQPQKNESLPYNLILKQRNASLPHFVQNAPIIQQNRSSQNISSSQLKNLLLFDKKEQHLNNEGYIKRDQQNDQNLSNTNNYFQNKQIYFSKLKQDKEDTIQGTEQSKQGEKMRRQQLYYQQLQNIKLPNQNYNLNLGINNFYQNYKKKMDSTTMFKSTNGQTTTPSTINESLMATLNNFNCLQKNINSNQQEQN